MKGKRRLKQELKTSLNKSCDSTMHLKNSNNFTSNSLWKNIPKKLVLKYLLYCHKHNLKAYIKTFGCCANEADSKDIEGYLTKIGITTVKKEDNADIIVINSCGVKTPTELKVLKYVNSLPKNKKIIVAGCLVDILKNLKQKTPNVRVFFGANKTYLIVPAIISLLFPEFKFKNDNFTKPKCRLKMKYNDKIAKIKVSQGCLGNCSFCCTKLARGHLNSKPIEKLLEEIKIAVKEGCKEIYLASQDMGCYGFDKNTHLVNLLKEITKIKGDFWIRIGMMNPQHILNFLEELIEIYKDKKIYKFIHIPVQSGSDRILNSMNRQYDVKDFEKVVKAFRKEIPNITVSTDIIVGFPGESEKDFRESYKIVKKIKPRILNLTRYYKRQGTKAAKFPDQFISREKKKRSRIISDLFEKINLDNKKEWLNKETEVLINSRGKYKYQYKGRNMYYLPVIVDSKKNILGDKVRVKIKKIGKNYLQGEIL